MTSRNTSILRGILWASFLSFFISLLFDSSFTCIFAEKDYFCRLSFFLLNSFCWNEISQGNIVLFPSFSLLHTREYDRCKWNNCKRRWKRDSHVWRDRETDRERIKERKKFILNIELILSVNTQSVSTSFRVGVCHQNNVLMKQNLKIHPLFLFHVISWEALQNQRKRVTPDCDFLFPSPLFIVRMTGADASPLFLCEQRHDLTPQGHFQDVITEFSPFSLTIFQILSKVCQEGSFHKSYHCMINDRFPLQTRDRVNCTGLSLSLDYYVFSAKKLSASAQNEVFLAPIYSVSYEVSFL